MLLLIGPSSWISWSILHSWEGKHSKNGLWDNILMVDLKISALTLMRLPNWIQMKWKQMRQSIDTDDYFKKSEKWVKTPAFYYPFLTTFKRFRWGYRYSLNLLVFSIGVFLSTFIPVILPAAALFFVIRLPVDKYNLLVTHNHTRSDFHIMKTVRRIMLVVVGTYQIAVFLFLLFNKVCCFYPIVYFPSTNEHHF